MGDTVLWLRGRALWMGRACGDCPNGPPCRCSAVEFMDSLSVADHAAVRYFLEAARG